MGVRLKSATVILLLCALIMTSLGGCNFSQDRGELITVLIGTHAQSEDDPAWRDGVTGEPAMSPDAIRAAEIALEKVKEELNVQIEWVQYSSDLQQLLLQTVLAGDPYCDLAILWNGVQGNILAQNILQPLDDYADIFQDDPEGQWILVDKSFGSYYLLNRDLLFVNGWPLCYNINYIEAVPALKENGETVYPSDLYKRGEWTWSKFEDYLGKIKAYYAGKTGPVNSSVEIVPFNTNYTYAALMAFHSNGSAVYDGTNMSFDTEDAKDAAEYVDGLITRGLMSCSTASSTSTNAGWLTASDAFRNGETVFTCLARWRMGSTSDVFAERGQSMAVIPFPRPDDVAADDPKYQHLGAVADSVGLMKGVSPEHSRLALEAYKLYKNTYYSAMARVDSISEYMNTAAESEALAFGIDIFHEKIGDDNLEIFRELGTVPGNEFAESIGVQGIWGADILGASIYGVNGMPKYATAIEANKTRIYTRIDNISKALMSGEVVDNVVPGVSKQNSDPIVFPAGTDPATINWSEILKASDNIDGDIDFSKIVIDYSGVDFNTVGTYTNALLGSVQDEAGNEGTGKFTVLVYDKLNTEPPQLTLKEKWDDFDRDIDAATIDWASKVVDSATDADGLDIKSEITADIGWVDVTVPGEYPVEIIANDFAGNETSQIIAVRIKE
ncbi:MAG: extracellular solute-binding protein [Clostridia bacterium]|nr:extracellular solute-binding protein [Clostridia bacterium]